MTKVVIQERKNFQQGMESLCIALMSVFLGVAKDVYVVMDVLLVLDF